MENYCLYIVQQSGVPIYYRNFSEKFADSNYPLVTSFFGAIMQFSQQIIQEQLNIIEIGQYRIFFRYQQDLIFIVITQNTSSVLLLNERLDRIVLTLYNTVKNIDEYLDSGIMIENADLDQQFEEIMHYSDDYSEKKVSTIKTLFEKEIIAGEIEAGALLSMRGEIFYSSLPLEDLHVALREIEIRTQVDTRDLTDNPKFIWQSSDKLIFSQTIQISSLGGLVYVILLFNSRRINIGMADWALEDISRKLESTN